MSSRFRLPVRLRIRMATYGVLTGMATFVVAVLAMRGGWIVFGAALLSISVISLVRAKAEEREALARATQARRAREAPTITVLERRPDHRSDGEA